MYLRCMALVLVTAGLAACQNSYQKTALPYGAATRIADYPASSAQPDLMYATAPCKPGCSGSGTGRADGDPLNSALYVSGNPSNPLPGAPSAASPVAPSAQFMPPQASGVAAPVAAPVVSNDDGYAPRRHHRGTRRAWVAQPAPAVQPVVVQPVVAQPAIAQPAAADVAKPIDPRVRQALQPVSLPKNYKMNGTVDLTKAPTVPSPSVQVPSNIAPTDYNRLAVPLPGNRGGAVSGQQPACQAKAGGSCGAALVPLPGTGGAGMGAGASSGLTPATLGGALAPQPAN